MSILHTALYKAYRWADRRRQAALGRVQKAEAPAYAAQTLTIARTTLGPDATLEIEYGHEHESGDPNVVFRIWNPATGRPLRHERWSAFVDEYCRSIPLPNDWHPILSSAAARASEGGGALGQGEP